MPDQKIIAVLRAGGMPDDRIFDSLLPDLIRSASGHFWTPVPVAHRAARWFRRAKARRVLDVGAGPGKFCVVAALLTEIDFVGVEQRADLVRAARTLATRLGAQRHAEFVYGTLESVRFWEFDGFYFYNPFGENMDAALHFDDEVELTTTRFYRDVAIIERMLDEIRVGSTVITYHGFGGRLPDTFELVRAEPFGQGRLRWWRKERCRSRGRFWIEDAELCEIDPE